MNYASFLISRPPDHPQLPEAHIGQDFPWLLAQSSVTLMVSSLPEREHSCRGFVS